jgi:hypothetical protein
MWSLYSRTLTPAILIIWLQLLLRAPRPSGKAGRGKGRGGVTILSQFFEFNFELLKAKGVLNQNTWSFYEYFQSINYTALIYSLLTDVDR